ncbi:MAG: M28 family metallopeptidase [Actinomycetota bacterium]
MRRVTVLVLVLGSLAQPAAASGAAAPAREPAAAQGTETFSTDAAFAHVRRLAGRIGPRPAGSAAYRRALRYVRGRFETSGFDVRRQGFRLPQGGRSWNLVARRPGDGDVRLLIGAHLDTVGGSPGGNDNASGVAVVLELARILSATGGPPPGLALVAFGAEEFQPGGDHHLGSDAYVDRMRAPERRALELMVSADMIGKVRRFIAASLNGTPRRGSRILARAARAVGFRANVRSLGDISDHGPFARAGTPAAFLWTGPEPNHHLPTDVVRNCRPRALHRAGAVLLGLIEDRLGALGLPQPHAIERSASIPIDQDHLLHPPSQEVGPRLAQPGLGGLPLVERLGLPRLRAVGVEIPPHEHGLQDTTGPRLRT